MEPPVADRTPARPTAAPLEQRVEPVPGRVLLAARNELLAVSGRPEDAVPGRVPAVGGRVLERPTVDAVPGRVEPLNSMDASASHTLT